MTVQRTRAKGTETLRERATRLRREYEALAEKHRKNAVTGGRNARIAERRRRLNVETRALLKAQDAEHQLQSYEAEREAEEVGSDQG